MPNHRPRFTAPFQALVAEDDAARTQAGGNLLAFATDPDPGDLLRLIAVDGLTAPRIDGRFGWLDWDMATGSFIYTLDDDRPATQRRAAGEVAEERFRLTVADQDGATATGRLMVSVLGANDAPRGRDQRQSTTEGSLVPVIGSLLRGASDPDAGDILRIATVNGSGAGVLEGQYGRLSWDAAGGYSYQVDTLRAATDALRGGERGREVFAATIIDQAGATALMTLTITVQGINDAPRAEALGFLPLDGMGGVIAGVSLLDGAFDPEGDAVTVAAVNRSVTPGSLAGTYGTLTWAADGSATYAADYARPTTVALRAGQAAEDVFSVLMADGLGGVAPRAVSFGVVGVNELARIAGTPTGSVTEDGTLTTAGQLSIRDPDAGESGFRAPATLDGLYGRFTFSQKSGAWSYQLDNALAAVQALRAGETLTDTLAVQSLDGSATRLVEVTVQGTDAAVLPEATPDAYAGTEDTALVVLAASGTGLLANDLGDASIRAVAGTWATLRGGTVSILADGGFVYAPAANVFGEDAFTYTLASADGDVSEGTVTINLAAVPDPIAPIRLATLGATGRGFTIAAETEFDTLGSAVAGAGDVNGDGLADLLLGAAAGGNDLFTGAAYVVFGKADTAEVSLAEVAAGEGGGYAIIAPKDNTFTGLAVAALGDITRDGLPEVLVASPSFADDDSGGRVYVVPGKADGAAVPLRGIEEAFQRVHFIAGEVRNDQAGYAVAGLPNVNGGTVPVFDMLIGAPGADGKGAAYVVYGNQGPGGTNLDDVATGFRGFKLSGEQSRDHAGIAVASAGDVNGDGRPDYAVGASGADVLGMADAGTTYVVFGAGATGSIALADVAAGRSPGFAIYGETPGGAAGRSLAGIGDMNGDGLDDLLVGAPGPDSRSFPAGAAYVVFGKASRTAVDLHQVALGYGGFKIAGLDPFRTGWSLAGIGDVNGDARPDILLSTRNTDPGAAAYVVFGKADTAPVDLADIAAGRGGFAIEGEGASRTNIGIIGERLPLLGGYTVAGAGDVNGDGLKDLLVGTGVETAHVIFGQASWAADTPLL